MGDGSAGFAGHVTQGEPGNLDAKVYLKVSDGASPTWAGCLWKEQGHASLVQLAFLSWVQPRETAAPQNQRCIDFCNFWAERHVLRDELSTSVSALGILWKFSGLMITHVISWRGWWSLSHPRKHPRCSFPNAEIYSQVLSCSFRKASSFVVLIIKPEFLTTSESHQSWGGSTQDSQTIQQIICTFAELGQHSQGVEQLGSGWARD